MEDILSKFNFYSGQLIDAKSINFNNKLRDFMKYINETDVIYNYIKSVNESEYGVEKEYVVNYINNLQTMGIDKDVIDPGETIEEQTSFIYYLLEALLESGNDASYLGFIYTNSRKFDDSIRAFNKEITMILIQSISQYIRELIKDMKEKSEDKGLGIAESKDAVYNIHIEDGQNILTMNSSLKQSGDIKQVKNEMINNDEIKEVVELIDSIEEDLKKVKIDNNIKNLIKTYTFEILEETKKNKSDKGKVKRLLEKLGLLSAGIPAIHFIGERIAMLNKLLL